jgi:hypothetical protein
LNNEKPIFGFSKIQNPIHSKTLLACRQCLTDGPKVEPLGVCPSETERVPNPHADQPR